jgi:hypothetical protein
LEGPDLFDFLAERSSKLEEVKAVGLVRPADRWDTCFSRCWMLCEQHDSVMKKVTWSTCFSDLDDFGWFWNLDHSGSGFGLTASPRSTAWGKWWRLVPAWDGSPCFGIAEMATCDSTGNRMFSISFFWVPYCKANAYFRDRSTSNNSWCWEGVLMGKRIQSTFWIGTLGVLTSAFADLCHV